MGEIPKTRKNEKNREKQGNKREEKEELGGGSEGKIKISDITQIAEKTSEGKGNHQMLISTTAPVCFLRLAGKSSVADLCVT